MMTNSVSVGQFSPDNIFGKDTGSHLILTRIVLPPLLEEDAGTPDQQLYAVELGKKGDFVDNWAH